MRPRAGSMTEGGRSAFPREDDITSSGRWRIETRARSRKGRALEVRAGERVSARTVTAGRTGDEAARPAHGGKTEADEDKGEARMGLIDGAGTAGGRESGEVEVVEGGVGGGGWVSGVWRGGLQLEAEKEWCGAS